MFRPATKEKVKLRLALIGPSGSGKTYTALRIAQGLGDRVAVIDTEKGSASLYVDDENPDGGRFRFDVAELEDHSLDNYIRAIRAAGKAGYDVLIIDSLSHAWMGRGGALEEVDRAAARVKGNKYVAWRHVTPKHNELIDTILQSPCHVVATMRAKTEYVQEVDERGKTVVRKVGLAPVQRDGMEYEFTLVADIDADHNLVVTKSRCAPLADAVINKAGAELAATLRAWLESGAEPAPRSERREEPARREEPRQTERAAPREEPRTERRAEQPRGSSAAATSGSDRKARILERVRKVEGSMDDGTVDQVRRDRRIKDINALSEDELLAYGKALKAALDREAA